MLPSGRNEGEDNGLATKDRAGDDCYRIFLSNDEILSVIGWMVVEQWVRKKKKIGFRGVKNPLRTIMHLTNTAEVLSGNKNRSYCLPSHSSASSHAAATSHSDFQEYSTLYQYSDLIEQFCTLKPILFYSWDSCQWLEWTRYEWIKAC